MVILVVPALALAAVAAAVVPQRLAAQAALDDTAAQLATMAAHWRQAQDRPHGPLDWYYPHCQPTVESATADGPALRDLCEAAAESMLSKLGAVGIDAGRLAGYHTSSLSTARTDAGTRAHQPSVPCRIDAETVAADAVHAAVTAPFAADDWTAGRIWHDGVGLTARATAQITRAIPDYTVAKLPDCTLLAAPNTRALADRAPSTNAFGNPRTP